MHFYAPPIKLRHKALALLLAATSIAAGGPMPLPAPPPPLVAAPNTAQVVAVWSDSATSSPGQSASVEQAASTDASLIAKTANVTEVVSGGTLHYTIVLTNATNVHQTFHVTDTLPSSLTYITNTAPSEIF